MSVTPTLDNSTVAPRYRVADLEVDVGKAEVTRRGQSVALPKLSFDLLCALIDAAPAIVTNEELLRRVWPGLLVSPESVAQRVKLLRSAIGDDSQRPRYILGVRSRGYRLIPLPELLSPSRRTGREEASDAKSRGAEDQAASITSHAVPIGPPSGIRKRVGLAAAALAAVGIAVIIGSYYRSSGHTIDSAPAAAMHSSIAVLPFADMSEKRDQEYFADGMAEELIATIARIPELRVPARTSSFYFKGRQATVAEIANALGVAYVLEGSVRTSGTMLRTNVQLIRAETGYHVWSQTYDRELRNVFQVQDEIAIAVVKALKLSLLAGAASGVTTTVNPEAYVLYLQARFLEQRDANGDYAPAVAYLKKALDIDPKFSLAWAELALVHTIYFDTFTSVPAKEIRREAVDCASRALTLSPDLPAAHLAMAKILSHIDWNWSAAEVEFNRVLQMDGANSDALLGLAKIAVMSGNLGRALELTQRVVAQDPLNYMAYFSLAAMHSRSGDYIQAEAAHRKVLELNPTGATGHFWLGYALLAQGKPSEALEEMLKEDDAATRRSGTMLALDALGRKLEAEMVVAEQEKNPSGVTANIAAFYACRKDADRAFLWLERAFERRDYYITIFGADFCFNNLKSDARYLPFLQKIQRY